MMRAGMLIDFIAGAVAHHGRDGSISPTKDKRPNVYMRFCHRLSRSFSGMGDLRRKNTSGVRGWRLIKPHLGMRWFKIGGEAGFGEQKWSGRPRRSSCASAAACGVFAIHFVRDTEKMIYLNRGGENRDVELMIAEAFYGFAQRRGVFGKIPLIDGKAGDISACRAQRFNEFRTGTAVFLDRDSFSG